MFGTDRRAYQQDWEDQPGNGMNNPIGDPLRNTAARNYNSDTKGQIPLAAGMHMGRVVETIPYLNTSIVSLGAKGIVQCAIGTQNSNSNWGISTSTVYNPGQSVLIYIPNEAQHGVIICAVADPVNEPNDWRPDSMFTGSNVGFYLAETANFWMGQDSNELIDFSAGRPLDSTSASESNTQGSTGVGTFQDDFMIGMKVDEHTGLFCFYDDSLTRLAGRNLEIWGYGLEKQWLNDEGELNGYDGHTPFAWEAMGAFKPEVKTSAFLYDNVTTTVDEDGNEVSSEADGTNLQLEGMRNGFVQPMSYDQQPFHRVVNYSGYLGQGGRKMIVTPGLEAEYDKELVNSYANDLRWLTMSSQQTTLAGTVVNCATGGYFVVKRPPQPTPKRKEKPESPKGDNNDFTWRYPKNYDAAGLPDYPFANHKVTNDIEIDTPTDGGEPVSGPESITAPEDVLRTALVADELAYLVSWESIHPFHYHKKDFYLPHESELENYNSNKTPPYESLSKAQYMGEDGEEYPEKASIEVDHRYGQVNIYLNTAFFGLRKDGNFVLRTGCGCEVKSENGTLVLAAPGDIRLQPGRNLVALAGHDTIIKARNSVDIISTEQDIRLAADRNFMVASAISEEGVMLFQSFSKCVIDEKEANTVYPEENDVPPEELEGLGPDFLLGEDTKGSGIVWKARRAQITSSSFVNTIKVGQKLYREEAGDGVEGFEPITEIDPDTGDFVDREWTWQGGKFRIIAEMGQVESFASNHIRYAMPKSDITNEEKPEDDDKATGAMYDVFLRAKQPVTDEEEPELIAEDFPPNVLAAAGVADLSSKNSCGDDADKAEGGVCYEVVQVNESRIGRATVCGDFAVNKELLVSGCAYFRGKVVSFDKIQGNFPFESFNGQMNAQRADIVAVFDEADTRCNQLLPPIMAEQVNFLVTDPTGAWLDFSYRTIEQYGTKDSFCIMENWWQHQIRVDATGKEEGTGDNEDFPGLPTGTVFWQEKPMKVLYANVDKVAPYPGAEYIRDEEKDDTPPEETKNCYGVYDLQMVDPETWINIDRDKVGDIEDPDSLPIYQDPKLKPGKQWRLSHYIAIDIPDPEEDDGGGGGGDPEPPEEPLPEEG